MITGTLTYRTTPNGSDVTIQLPPFEIPLTKSTIEGAVDVETLDNNVSTYFIRQKQSWNIVFAYLYKSDYEAIRNAYDAQFTSFRYPSLSMPFYNVVDLPVRMTMNDRTTVDNCGTIDNVQITLRESRQRP